MPNLEIQTCLVHPCDSRPPRESWHRCLTCLDMAASCASASLPGIACQQIALASAAQRVKG